MKASADLIEAWQANPQAEVDVIVHVERPAAAHEKTLVDLGMRVGRVFRLTSTISARGRARVVLDLLQEPWVQRIELDAEIRALT
jgi:hypothetical protein